ncbi:ArsR/SmtB family transcription factor [Companilactobacillus kimchiensis]|uniref:ArsR family transcriptional regulator n=1 Tax=Companilactobacillus kimchiensis TaxID=993692 RepID=A0A0R2LHM4_9LACO|nr:metalloregulator ArsR/SmtB family transcription factor [Companilactobacillus kimchiensis]KRN98826.1 ArsR family transcriptional regulator [Companilactobacillus kimchiensis]
MLDEKVMNYKNSLYSELAKIGKSLSSNKRLEIMDLLTQGPKTVEAIAVATGLSIANTSRHLQVLREGNLVKRTRDKNFVVYSLATASITNMFYQLRDVGEEQLSAIKQIQNSYNESEEVYTLTLAEAYDKMQQNNIELLDVRPQDEYEAGHVDQAINIPIDELESELDKVPTDKEIIVYCRGHLCAYTNMATRLLNDNGRRAFSLNESYYDWQRFLKTK